jgi:aconitate hydratase
VLSGNRNFEGRINSDVRMNYLMSPPLVVAYALAGTVDIDLTTEPLGTASDGTDVYLRDVWPSREEVDATIRRAVRSEMFSDTYRSVFDGDHRWQGLDTPSGENFAWEPTSTYVRQPPFLTGIGPEPPPLVDVISDARALAVLGDSVTTDHISPAGAISPQSPAGLWLLEQGVTQRDFNSYGARRGNHEVMIRGTFANGRIRNRLADGAEGGVTVHLPDGELMSIYDAAMRYRDENVPLLVLAGKDYGSGSSRDWAAKGTSLLGVVAVLAESYERIHRSNLIGMGVLPLQYAPGDSAESLGLTGHEHFTIEGAAVTSIPSRVTVRADDRVFEADVRIDTAMELDYYRHGGILPYVLRSHAVR